MGTSSAWGLGERGARPAGEWTAIGGKFRLLPQLSERGIWQMTETEKRRCTSIKDMEKKYNRLLPAEHACPASIEECGLFVSTTPNAVDLAQVSPNRYNLALTATAGSLSSERWITCLPLSYFPSGIVFFLRA